MAADSTALVVRPGQLITWGDPDGTYTWRIDFDVMEELLHSFFETDLWDVVEAPPGRTVLHFVKASESSTLDEDALMRLRGIAGKSDGRVTLHTVKGGHWLNADNPDALIELMTTQVAAH